MVCLEHSIEAWGSELLFRRRITIFALDLGSESSASDFGEWLVVSFGIGDWRWGTD